MGIFDFRSFVVFPSFVFPQIIIQNKSDDYKKENDTTVDVRAWLRLIWDVQHAVSYYAYYNILHRNIICYCGPSGQLVVTYVRTVSYAGVARGKEHKKITTQRESRHVVYAYIMRFPGLFSFAFCARQQDLH
jgi:hypothetical protein